LENIGYYKAGALYLRRTFLAAVSERGREPKIGSREQGAGNRKTAGIPEERDARFVFSAPAVEWNHPQVEMRCLGHPEFEVREES